MENLRNRFGSRIRSLREATGMAQENFAYEYGIARTHLGNIERGLANPSLDVIETLARALCISVADLFTDEPIPNKVVFDNKAPLLRQSFGARARAIRESLGLSQERFAHKWGVDRTYVSKVDRGLANPSLDAIESLTAALDISIVDFFSGIKQ